MSAFDAAVVELGAVGRASLALARWYRGLVVTGEGDVGELGQARADLASLPAQPGPLGRAIQLVVCGGDDATDDEILAAVSLLCDAASRAADPPEPVAPPPTPTPVPVARRRRRVPGRPAPSPSASEQPCLPGFSPSGDPRIRDAGA